MAAAFEADVAAVRRAHMLTGEIGEAALLARDGRLDEAALHLGRPIRFMLATPVADAAEVMRRVGDEAWIEDKYDGIRAQLHVEANGTVRLFSRDLNDVTRSFPEIAEAAALLASPCAPCHRRRAGAVAAGIGPGLRLAPDATRPGATVGAASQRGAGRAGRVRPAPRRRARTCSRPSSGIVGRASRRSPCLTGPASGSCCRTSPAPARPMRSTGTSTMRANAITKG